MGVMLCAVQSGIVERLMVFAQSVRQILYKGKQQLVVLILPLYVRCAAQALANCIVDNFVGRVLDEVA